MHFCVLVNNLQQKREAFGRGNKSMVLAIVKALQLKEKEKHWVNSVEFLPIFPHL